jgi:chromosome partitioning protein
MRLRLAQHILPDNDTKILGLTNMPIISIAIQKGGSGKTTTAINLAAALMRKGKRILLIDADPQSNLSQSLGVPEETAKNLYTELKKEIAGQISDLKQVINHTKSGLKIIPSSIDLAGTELELVSIYGREKVLAGMLEALVPDYDYIFIDCPPAIGMLTVNALVASDFVLIPMQAEFLPLKGLWSFMHHMKMIRSKLNNHLEILGIVLTRFDEHKLMNRQIYQTLKQEFGEKIFRTRIRSNMQLAKAQEAGLDIFSFDAHAHGAEDYEGLSEEFILKINHV